MITVDEPTREIVVPVEGGGQGLFRYTETIAACASVAAVFVVVEIR